MTPPTATAQEPIYIGDLGRIVNREVNTIRKWEREGKLPKSLLPKRGDRGRRYWTHSQVHGKKGIIAWMKKNDMRPGNTISDPAKADEHVRALRRPKYLNNNMIDVALKMVNDKKTAKEITDRLYPLTRYSSPENLEAALRRYFRQQGWTFPNADRGTSIKGKGKPAQPKKRKK